MSLFLQLDLDYVSAFLPWSRDLPQVGRRPPGESKGGGNVGFFWSVALWLMGLSPFMWSFIQYVSNTKYEIMQPTYNIIQNTKNHPLLDFFTSDSRSLFAMYVDSSIETSTSWMILTSKGPWCGQTTFRFVHKIVQLFLKKEPRFFCGFFLLCHLSWSFLGTNPRRGSPV